MCGVSMQHPVTTQPEPEAKRTHSIPGRHETGYVMCHRQGREYWPSLRLSVCTLYYRTGVSLLRSQTRYWESKEHGRARTCAGTQSRLQREARSFYFQD